MATHSSIHTWRIPWTEEPVGLQSIRSQRVRHNWSDSALHTCYVYVYTHIHVFASQRHQIVYGIKDPDLIWLTFFTTRTPIRLLGDIPGTIFLRDVFHLCPCALLNFHLGNRSRWLGCKWKKKKADSISYSFRTLTTMQEFKKIF